VEKGIISIYVSVATNAAGLVVWVYVVGKSLGIAASVISSTYTPLSPSNPPPTAANPGIAKENTNTKASTTAKRLFILFLIVHLLLIIALGVVI